MTFASIFPLWKETRKFPQHIHHSNGCVVLHNVKFNYSIRFLESIPNHLSLTYAISFLLLILSTFFLDQCCDLKCHVIIESRYFVVIFFSQNLFYLWGLQTQKPTLYFLTLDVFVYMPGGISRLFESHSFNNNSSTRMLSEYVCMNKIAQ